MTAKIQAQKHKPGTNHNDKRKVAIAKSVGT